MVELRRWDRSVERNGGGEKERRKRGREERW